jgi:hypothetical protein
MAISIPSLLGWLRLWASGSEDLICDVEDTLSGTLADGLVAQKHLL